MKKISLAIIAFVSLLIAACSSSKSTSSSSSLTGEWNIIAVKGAPVDASKMLNVPFIGFDRKEKKVYGNAGCNNFFAALKLDTVNSKISFSNAGATRMMGPNMETEDAILKALNEVDHYKVLDNGDFELYDKANAVQLLIQKKK